RRRLRDGTIARIDACIDSSKRVSREIGVFMVRIVAGRIARISVPDELSGKDCRTLRHEMAEPRGPCAVVGDSAETKNTGCPILDVAIADHGCRFMDNGLVESRSPAPSLIDEVSRNAVAHKVRIPSFASIRRRFQTCSRVG